MRILKQAVRGLAFAAGAICIGLLHLARPLRKIKIGRIRTDRIGHLACNTDGFLRKRALGRIEQCVSRIFIAGAPCNRQLLDMIKRVLPVVESDRLAKLHDLCVPLLQRTPLWEPMPFSPRAHAEFNAAPSQLSFTPEEEERGRLFLSSVGLKNKDWFICFHNRDSAYLQREQPSRDWSYHDYRDCDVKNFLPAAEYITRLGGFALRMGSAVSEPLGDTTNPRLIDYAAKYRNDFLDVYLLAKCRFMLGCDTGLTLVATAFDTPVVYTNSARLDFAPFLERDIFIQKKYFDEATNRVLSYRDILARGHEYFLNSSYLSEHRLHLVENTTEEILDATREMQERLTGIFQESPEDRELQQRYGALFTARHTCYAHQSHIGRDFLRRNKDVLFGNPLPKNGVA